MWAVLRVGGKYLRFDKREVVVGGAELCDVVVEGLCTRHLVIRWSEGFEWPEIELLCEHVGGSVRMGEDEEEVVMRRNEDGRGVIRAPMRAGSKLVAREAIGGQPVEFDFSFVAGLPDRDYEWLHVLGVGSQAEVKLVRAKATGALFAAKIFHKKTVLARGRTVGQALAECVGIEYDVLQRLHHPNIIQLHSVFETPQHLVLILDYCDGPDLYRLITDRQARCEGNPFTDAECKHIFRQAAEAVAYLHRHHIAHRDIKPSNFLICTEHGDPLTVKLTDFGTAKVFGAHHMMHRIVFTPLYLAPEMLEYMKAGASVQGYTEEIDVWSLGVVFFNILVGQMPFDTVEHILCGKFDVNLVEDEHARSLVQLMLQVDPTSRITMDKVLCSPYLLIREAKRARTDHSMA